MSERYTIERGDWGLFFYDQKKKKGLSFEDVGDILNGIEGLNSEIVEDLKEYWNSSDLSSNFIKKLIEKWEKKGK